ncbi:Tautomerase enzyme [Mycobacterium shigaense]|uniref:Tautomerase enzyme n=1 Tax=Mycobacterium shigaense TaxID=722731 RepID=UPI000E578AF1|nr:Tautomerase enzyme [Mycobacterium shigaense]
MPMLDVYIPEQALPAEAERQLLRRLAEILIEHEGADPSDPVARSLAKVWLHRPAAMLHVGDVPSAPHYKVIASVPQGQLDDVRAASAFAAITDAILAAEAGRYDQDPLRIWVIGNEIPEGNWGAGGRAVRLADIAATVLRDVDKGREYAQQRLAGRRAVFAGSSDG